MSFTKKKIIWLAILASSFMVSCNRHKQLFESLSPSSTHVNFENKLEDKHLFNILYYLYFYNGGGVATGDINNDGLPDIYFTANSKGNDKLYLNKGNFQFEDITAKAGVTGSSDWCTGVTMADVNGDGYLDIYVSAVSNKYGLKGHNQLFINNRIPSTASHYPSILAALLQTVLKKPYCLKMLQYLSWHHYPTA